MRNISKPSSGRRVVAVMAAAAALAAFAAPGAAAVVWGTTADGSATQGDDAELSSQHDGGAGQASAQVQYDHPSTGYFASAALGDASMPIDLGISATAGVGTNSFFQAFASATGTQQFTYVGSETAVFTIVYALDGALLGDFITEVYGGLTVYDGSYDPGDEVHGTLGEGFSPDADSDVGAGFAYSRMDGTCVSAPCAPQPFDLSGGVTFEVAPGDTFFVKAQLFGDADSRFLQSLTYVDAAHTLVANFSAGNTSLLVTPQLAAVPEPAAWAMMLLGFAGAGAVLRRRRPAVYFA